jgi:hypothetical protein
MYADIYQDVYDETYVLSPNAIKDNWTSLGIPPSNLITDVTEKNFMTIVKRASDNFEYNTSKGNNNFFTLIILDDIADRTRYWKDFVDTITRCRHDGTTIWLLLQDTKFIMPNVRAQIWAHSISPRYSTSDALARVASGKNIPVRRTRETPEEDQVLIESMAGVREKNKQYDTSWGRLFISNVGPTVKHFYQNGSTLEELPNNIRTMKTKNGQRQVLLLE